MTWLAISLWLAALAVAAGAFGAHGLRERLDPSELELWETAARYLMYGALSLGLLGLGEHLGERSVRAAALLLVGGTVIFAGTVAALALGGPRWLGAITPIGGVGMILGLALGGWMLASGGRG